MSLQYQLSDARTVIGPISHGLLVPESLLRGRPTRLQPLVCLRSFNQRCNAAATSQALVEHRGQRWSPEQYAGLWSSQLEEESYEIEDIEGRLPHDLCGTWYRNGPGIFELDGQPMHAFDGHGLVARVAVENGRAHFRCRFVRTPVFEEEMQRNKVLYRGFGTTKPGGALQNLFDIRDKPVANTSLAEWNGKLWALWEAHKPFILNPDTLDTLGEETLDGYLADRWLQPPRAFCAHPKFDPVTGRLCAFGLGLRAAEGNLRIMEIDADGTLASEKVIPGIFSPLTYVHDFAVTRNWYIFFRPPLRPNLKALGGYLLGQVDQTKMVEFDGEKSGQWLLIARDPNGPTIEIDTPPQFIWHFANAEEHPVTGVLTVDACVFDEFSPGSFDLMDPSTMSKSTLCRCVVDPQQQTASRTELAPTAVGDFPQINPAFSGEADYKYVYLTACTEPGSVFPLQSCVKIDVQHKSYEEWKAPNGCFCGEAVFVPRGQPATLEAIFDEAVSGNGNPRSINGSLSSSSSNNGCGSGSGHMAMNGNGSSNNGSSSSNGIHGGSTAEEDDGYLILPLYDGTSHQSRIVILDAREPAAGPVCQLHLRRPLPFAFHCMWSDNCHHSF